jgi:hypothetical protein
MASSTTEADDRAAQHVLVALPVPLEKARAEQWEIRYGPTVGAKGTMGELLDSKTMDIVDLAYIIKRRPSPAKVAAALTLLAHQLGEPQTIKNALRYGPKVLGDNKYLEEQQYSSIFTAFIYGALGAFVVVGLSLTFLWNAAQRVFGGEYWLVTATALLIVLIGLVLPIGWYARRKWTQELANFRAYRDGREGEEWTVDAVRATLDSRWTAFRGVKLPGRKSDIDLVLIGPPGVWALEIKSYNARIRVQGSKWEYLKGAKWRSLDGNPVGQVRTNAQQLRYFLEEHGVKLHVNAAVLITTPQQVSNFGPTDEPVWLSYEIENQLNQLNNQPQSLIEAERERAIAGLTKTVDGADRRVQ